MYEAVLCTKKLKFACLQWHKENSLMAQVDSPIKIDYCGYPKNFIIFSIIIFLSTTFIMVLNNAFLKLHLSLLLGNGMDSMSSFSCDQWYPTLYIHGLILRKLLRSSEWCDALRVLKLIISRYVWCSNETIMTTEAVSHQLKPLPHHINYLMHNFMTYCCAVIIIK